MTHEVMFRAPTEAEIASSHHNLAGYAYAQWGDAITVAFKVSKLAIEKHGSYFNGGVPKPLVDLINEKLDEQIAIYKKAND